MTPGCLGGFDHTCLVVGLLLCKLTGFSSSSAPCTPANVGLTYSCETGITLLTWDETLGRQSFYATVRSGDHELSCSTNQTDCSLPSLLCGRTYDVEVVGVADHCNSTVPGVAQMQTGKGSRQIFVCLFPRATNLCFFTAREMLQIKITFLDAHDKLASAKILLFC